MLGGQIKDFLPMLPRLTQIWGHFRCLNKWGQVRIFSYIKASGGTNRAIIAHPIEHYMDSRFMVNLTPKVKVYGSKVKFSTRLYGDEN